MVGLLSSEVREAKERVRTALKNMEQPLPYGRITVNLSPADTKKEGAAFDLAIAVALLVNMRVIKSDRIKDFMILGELGLNGDVKKVKGVLPIIIMAKQKGFQWCMIPFENMAEGSIIDGIKVVAVKNLREAVDYLNGAREIPICDSNTKNRVENNIEHFDATVDFLDIHGHSMVKRAVTVAVAGRHNLLMIGPPGVGKSMIASRIPGIMPDMSNEEILEISSIHSICGTLKDKGLIRQRPFQAPHHSVTLAALVGGGAYPKPGELTKAHGGVLFLDELPEFQMKVLDALRQPLEEKMVRIVRNAGEYEFPADCLFVAAMNPCRCGFYPDRNKCNCSINEVKNYLGKVSGPFIDRMDLCVDVPRQSFEEMEQGELKQKGKSSREIQENINRAAEIQLNRNNGKFNSHMSVSDIKKFCELDSECNQFMHKAYQKFSFSMRSYYKIIKTARTIADLEETHDIRLSHLAEALGYRTGDEKYWGR